MLQVESTPQDTLHSPVQVTLQSAPLPHETLPLSPTVTSQLESIAQEMLHESPQLPWHTLPSRQASEQLSAPQLLWVKSQLVPEGQVQLAPVQVTGCASPQPAAIARMARIGIVRRIVRMRPPRALM